MKKYFLLAALMLGFVAADARDYKHSIGVNAGNLFGLTYKEYVRQNEHFVFQLDANVQLGFAPQSRLFVFDEKGKSVVDGSVDPFNFQAIVVNPNLMFQGRVGDWSWASMHLFIGGGVDLGVSWKTPTWSLAGWSFRGDTQYWGKINEHLITGFEFDFKGAPINLGLDFRPGIGELVYVHDKGNMEALVFFDWGAAVSVRFRMGK